MSAPAHTLRDLPSPRGGIVRGTRRPSGWSAPGPRPPGEPSRFDLWPSAGEDLCWLSGDFRILQRTDGHRWSLDDLATAWYATESCEVPPTRTIDLGCGIGTVLLFTAWRFPETRCVGIEAQEVSAAMAQRSIAWNGIEGRCEVRQGDFREGALTPEGAVYNLVTGTPPYFPSGTGLESEHTQRAPCRFEHRGGIEDYCLTASRLLAEGGRFVACQASIQSRRIEPAAATAGLVVERWRDVVPRAGKPPLFCLFALRRQEEATTPQPPDRPLVVRDERGQWTDEFRALREAMGMPPGMDRFTST